MSDRSNGDAPQADSGAMAERPLALLYLSGSAADVDSTTTRLLAGLTKDVRIATAPTPQAARATIENAASHEHFQALFLSPTLGEREVLHVVTTFRKARTPVAIVPIVTEAHQGLRKSAVAAGADSVMPLRDGVFVAPDATLKCIWNSPHRQADEARSDRAAAVGLGPRTVGIKLQAFLRGLKTGEPTPSHDANGSERTPEGARMRLVLNEAHVAPVRPEPVVALEQLTRDSVERIVWESTRSELDAALEAAQKDLQESVGCLTADRSAWAGKRYDLEARIVELRAAVSAGANLQTALETSRHKLQQFSEQCATERTAWDDERQRLEARLADLEIAARSADELKAALEETRRKLRQTFDLHSQQQRVWETGRRELETEVNDLRIAVAASTGVEEALEATRRELHQTRDRYESDRSAWDLTQRDLDARVEHATGQAASARAELGALGRSLEEERRALADARAELERIGEAQRSELAAHHAIQAGLEGQLNTLQTTAAAAKTAADDALEQAHRELKQARERHACDRSAWDTERRERDARVADVNSRAAAAHKELEGLRQNLDEERQAVATARAEIERISEAGRSELAARDASQADLERQVNTLQTAAAAAKTAADDALEQARRELKQARERYASECSAWDKDRREQDARVADATNRAAATRSELERLRRSLEEERQALATARAEIERLAVARHQLSKDLEARDADAQAATTARLDLETLLSATCDELQATSDRHRATSAAADEARERLESQLHDLQTTTAELTRDLAAAHADLQRTRETHETQQAQSDAARRRLVADLAETKRENAAAMAKAVSSWETERQQLERALQAHQIDVSTAVAAKAELEALLADVRSELQRAITDHRASSNDWAVARGELEARLSALEATRQELEEQLGASHRKLDETGRAQAAQFAAADAARQQLEREVADLREAVSTHDTMRSVWDAERLKHEGDLAASLSLVTEATTARADLESRLEAAESDLKRLGDGYADKAAAWEAARRQLQAELEARLRDAAIADRERQRLGDELLEMRSSHGRLSAAHQTLELQLGEETSRVRRLTEESAGLRAELHALSTANDRRRLEERLYRACRIEEVGHLAATMVSDLEALVSTIEDHGGRLARELDRSDAREDAERIHRDSERVRRMLHQLAVFSERQARPVSTLDIDDAVARMEPTIARLAGTGVDFNMRVGSHALVPILDDDLDQLLTTLVFSARSLLAVGGSLIVETSIADRDETGRSRLCLAVTASGYGAQPAESSPALELVARRCSAELIVDGAPGTSMLRVYLPVASVAA